VETANINMGEGKK